MSKRCEYFCDLPCKLLSLMTTYHLVRLLNYVEFYLYPKSQLWSEYFCLIQLVAGGRQSGEEQAKGMSDQ